MKLTVGVVGLGYWGPSYLRNFIKHEQVQLAWACDLENNKLKETSHLYPHVHLTNNYNDLLEDESLDLIAIATPPESHYQIAKASLEKDKHVLVAKPLTTDSRKALDLLNLAKKKDLMLHGDLTFLYTGTVKKVQSLIKNNSLGSPLYYDSTRTNLGLIQQEINVIWDLAIHDLAIIDYCFNLEPKKVFAVASRHLQNSKKQEMAHITLYYPSNFIAHIHVSWLAPVKIRTVLIGGTKKMIFWDDVVPDEKLKIYDKGVEVLPSEATPLKPVYRSGDVIIPKLDNEEALFVEVKDIVSQIINNKIDYSISNLNIKILKILEACDKSLRLEKPIFINSS